MAAAGVWVIYGVHAMGASKSLMMHHETRIVYLARKLHGICMEEEDAATREGGGGGEA
jgi:hypothetical protein